MFHIEKFSTMNSTNLTNDNKNNSFDDDDQYFSHLLSITQSSIYIPIFFAGIINNLITILIISLNRDMHTVTNCYLLNLAISDSLPLIVSLPFEVTFLPIKAPFGELGCKFRSLIAETSTNASILTISAFTIERYLAVCHPLRISSLSTIGRAIKIEILMWFIAILFSTPYFYFTIKFADQCNFNPNFPTLVSLFFHISATIFFVIPAGILCIMYGLIARRLYAAGVRQERLSKSSGTDSTSPAEVLGSSEQKFNQHRHSSTASFVTRSIRASSGRLLSFQINSMKKSAFKMLFAVVIAFIICYAPFHVQRLITSQLYARDLSLIERRIILIFYFISGIFYYLGSTINPIFYHLFSRKYRTACIRTMKHLIHCRRRSDHPHLFYPTIPPPQKPTPKPPVTKFVCYATLPQISNKYKTGTTVNTKTLHTTMRRRQLLRLSLPALTTSRVR